MTYLSALLVLLPSFHKALVPFLQDFFETGTLVSIGCGVEDSSPKIDVWPWVAWNFYYLYQRIRLLSINRISQLKQREEDFLFLRLKDYKRIDH